MKHKDRPNFAALRARAHEDYAERARDLGRDPLYKKSLRRVAVGQAKARRRAWA